MGTQSSEHQLVTRRIPQKLYADFRDVTAKLRFMFIFTDSFNGQQETNRHLIPSLSHASKMICVKQNTEHSLEKPKQNRRNTCPQQKIAGKGKICGFNLKVPFTNREGGGKSHCQILNMKESNK